MKDNNELVDDGSIAKEYWDDGFDREMNYHDLSPSHWTSVNEDIVKAIETDGIVPPITFASYVTLDHMKSEVEFELRRMRNRTSRENDGAAQYFRSTYAKYIIWMILVKATLDKKLVSVAQAASVYKVSQAGVRSIIEECVDAGYALRKRIGNRNYYCASNATMVAWTDRLVRESEFFTDARVNNMYAFKSFVAYLTKKTKKHNKSWFQRK